MKTLGIAENKYPSVLDSLLPSNYPARNECHKLKLKSIHIQEMIDGIKKKILFDCEIENLRVTLWNSKIYEQFRSTTNSDESVTQKCLEFMK